MNIQQVYSKDLSLWHPTTKRAYDNPLWASVTQIDGRAKVSIPATSKAVQRKNGFAAYLKFPFYTEPTIQGSVPAFTQVTRLKQEYPDSEGNISPRIVNIYNVSQLVVTSDGNPSPAPPVLDMVNGVVLVEGSFNNGGAANVPSVADPTDVTSNKPFVGVFGQAIPGRVTSSNEQNLWLVDGNSSLGSVAGFAPKTSVDTVTITKNIDNTLTVHSVNRAIGLSKLFSTYCVIEADVGLDRLFCTGGMTSWATLSPSGASTILDILGNTYPAATCPMSLTKSSAISIPTSGCILVTGGLTNMRTDSLTGTAMCYNPYNNSWSYVFGPNKRRDHKSIILDGGINNTPSTEKWVLVVGGKRGISFNVGQTGPDVFPIGVPINTCEVMDVTSSSHGQIPLTPFVSTGSMSDARYAFGMTKLKDNRVLVCGGIGYNPSYPITDDTVPEYLYELNRCEIFDPTTGFWSPIQSMLEPHSYCVCHYVPEANKVYVYGGYTSKAIEYLDLNTMTWHKSVYTMANPVVGGSAFGTEFGFMGLLGGGHYDIGTSTFTSSSYSPPLM
jgi:hypothetical protein